MELYAPNRLPPGYEYDPVPLQIPIDINTLRQKMRGWPKAAEALAQYLSKYRVPVNLQQLKREHGSRERTAKALYAIAQHELGGVNISNPSHPFLQRKQGRPHGYTPHWYFRLHRLVTRVKKRLEAQGEDPTDEAALRYIAHASGHPTRWEFEVDQCIKHYATQQAAAERIRTYPETPNERALQEAFDRLATFE